MVQALDDDLRDETVVPLAFCRPLVDARTTPDERLQVAVNAGSNAGVQFIKAVVVFLVMPIMVHRLGDARFGIWLFISSITAYLYVGDFGVKSAIIRFVARYDGLRDREGINRIVNASSAILSLVAAVVAAITFLAAWLWRLPSSVPPELAGEARWFFVLSGIQVAALLPISVPQAALAGLGQFPLRNAISVISLLVRHAAWVIVVLLGGGLPAVGAVALANCALDYGMSCWALRRCFPEWRRSYRYFDREMLRTLCGYGAHVFAGDIATIAISQSAPLIIGLCLVSTVSNTYFGQGAYLKDNVLGILGMVVLVLVPAVSKWQALGDHGAIRGLLVHAMRYALYFTLPIEFGLLLLGYPFLTLWMGQTYADAGCKVLYILSLPLAVSAIGMVAARVLQGIGKVGSLAFLTWVQAALTVQLSVALSQAYGIDGVAWGVSLALLVCAPATALLMCRYLRVNPLALLLRATWGPLLASAAAAAVWYGALRWLPQSCSPTRGWLAFAGVGLLGTAPYAAIVLILERDFRRAAGRMARSCAATVSSAARFRRAGLGPEETER